MGKIVNLAAARMARAGQRAADEQARAHAEIQAALRRGEGCPWTAEELVEGWSDHVRRSWRPRTGIKRGCIKRVMRRAHQESDQGVDWIKVCPATLICEALPDPWGEDNLGPATYLTMLLYDYLFRIAAISDADRAFAFEWCRRSQEHILAIAKRDGSIPRLPPLPRPPRG